MAPEIEPPQNLVALRKARDMATSDAEYIWGLERVYAESPERRVEWDIQCGLADRRKEKAWMAYDLALKNYLDSNGESYV